MAVNQSSVESVESVLVPIYLPSSELFLTMTVTLTMTVIICVVMFLFPYANHFLEGWLAGGAPPPPWACHHGSIARHSWAFLGTPRPLPGWCWGWVRTSPVQHSGWQSQTPSPAWREPRRLCWALGARKPQQRAWSGSGLLSTSCWSWIGRWTRTTPVSAICTSGWSGCEAGQSVLWPGWSLPACPGLRWAVMLQGLSHC